MKKDFTWKKHLDWLQGQLALLERGKYPGIDGKKITVSSVRKALQTEIRIAKQRIQEKP